MQPHGLLSHLQSLNRTPHIRQSVSQVMEATRSFYGIALGRSLHTLYGSQGDTS